MTMRSTSPEPPPPCIVSLVKISTNTLRTLFLRGGVALATLFLTYLLFRAPFHARLRSLLDPYSFSGDALQHIPPLWYAHERVLFSFDYVREYYWSALFPPLFKATYWVVTFFAEPAAASKIISCVLAFLFIATLTRASWVLAGRASAFVTLLLATGGTLKNFPFMSGLQRGFGTWLCAVMLLCIVEGNIVGLGVTITITALFYPAAAVFGLTTLGLILCLPQRFLNSTRAWTLKRRVITLATVAVSTSLAVVPQLIAGSRYGERLSITHELEFQEWGPNGRYTQGDRGVPMSFTQKFLENSMASLLPGKLGRVKHTVSDADTTADEPSRNELLYRELIVTLVGSVLCALVLVRRAGGGVSPKAARIGVYTVSIGASFAVATVVFPLLYIPTRYVVITLPALIPVVFPALWTRGTAALLTFGSARTREVSGAAVGVTVLALTGWFSLSVRPMPTASGHRELLSYIRSLPRESVIAGWPRGSLDTISLFTGRNVLLHEEAHQIFHRDFLLECRKRMRAIVKLYAATDRTAVDELRREYGVTHLLMDRKHLKNTPSYFAPFKDEIIAARATNMSDSLYLERLAQEAAVFRLQHLVLIDLSKVPLP